MVLAEQFLGAPRVLEAPGIGKRGAVRGMTENARREHRDRGQRRVALRDERGVFREGSFRDVPFAMLQEAKEDLLDRQAEAGEPDASGTTRPAVTSSTWS